MLDQKITYHLECALSGDPQNADILKLASKFYLNKNHYIRVETLLDNFKNHKESDFIFFIKAQIAFKKKEYPAAAESIARCVDLNPSIDHLSLAYEIELYHGNTNNILNYLNLLVEKDSKNGWHYYELAKLLDPESEFQRIFYLIETSILLLNYHEKPVILKYEMLLEYQINLQNTPYYKTIENILHELDQILNKKHKNCTLKYYVSWVNYKNKNFNKAIQILGEKSESNKDLFLLGKCFFKKKKFATSFKYFNKTKLSRKDSFFLNKLKADCLLKINKTSDAKKYLTLAHDLYEIEQDKNNELYDLHLKKNRYREAKKILFQKIKAKTYMSDICLSLHHFNNSHELYYLQKSLNINSQNSDALYEMGKVHKKKCVKEALTYFLKCVQNDWTHTGAHIQLSLIYKELGQIQNYLKHKKIAD